MKVIKHGQPYVQFLGLLIGVVIWIIWMRKSWKNSAISRPVRILITLSILPIALLGFFVGGMIAPVVIFYGMLGLPYAFILLIGVAVLIIWMRTPPSR